MSNEKTVKIRSVKREIRILGIDDGAFVPHWKGLASVFGVVYRGGLWFDGIMYTEVRIDGMDATEKLVSMIINSPHYHQLRVVMLNGITLAGFNIIDLKVLFNSLSLPIINITRDKPNLKKIKKALEKLPEPDRRWKAIQNAGERIKVKTKKSDEPIYLQIVGIEEIEAKKILQSTSTRSNVPEALRVAHLIASGLTKSVCKLTASDDNTKRLTS